MTLGCEAFALGLDDPAEMYGDPRGERVPFGLDLEWDTDGDAYAYPPGTTRYEVPCRVHGEILVGDETIEFDGIGQRDHSWGVRDWWTLGWTLDRRVARGRHALPRHGGAARRRHRAVPPGLRAAARRAAGRGRAHRVGADARRPRPADGRHRRGRRPPARRRARGVRPGAARRRHRAACPGSRGRCAGSTSRRPVAAGSAGPSGTSRSRAGRRTLQPKGPRFGGRAAARLRGSRRQRRAGDERVTRVARGYCRRFAQRDKGTAGTCSRI